MSQLPKVAISVGDLNGVGIELILRSHMLVTQICQPFYCINENMLGQAAKLLNIQIPSDFKTLHVEGSFEIQPGVTDASSGKYSYDSFIKAIESCEAKEVDAVVTLAIHKEAWSLANINYVGHTDLLRDYFKKDAIMMLGCEEMYVALYTEHIPLQKVSEKITKDKIKTFLEDFYKSVQVEKVGVLGLNPHAGDNGVLGLEDKEIEKAIIELNKKLEKNVFEGPLVPDIAFTPNIRKNYKYFIAMYHDQGLGPLKALYFDQSVNISLNLPIIRTSVDHGTAFDIAYKNKANNLSYINAIKSAVDFSRQNKDN